MATTMPDAGESQALLRLMAWLSPAFPTGAFSYSNGLEGAVADGFVHDADDLADWLGALIRLGPGHNDAVFFAAAWRAAKDREALEPVAELGQALAGSAERHLETMLQGSAFLRAAADWPGLQRPALPAECPLPVAIGAMAGANRIALDTALAAYLQTFASNMIQAAIRLGVTGQAGAVAVLAGLEDAILGQARLAATTNLDDLGSATIAAEIAAMRHETQYSRLFRS